MRRTRHRAGSNVQRSCLVPTSDLLSYSSQVLILANTVDTRHGLRPPVTFVVGFSYISLSGFRMLFLGFRLIFSKRGSTFS